MLEAPREGERDMLRGDSSKGEVMTKLLYLECASGISGDMCAAALLDLGASEQAVRRALESLPVEGFSVVVSRVRKSGLDVCDFNVVLDAVHENNDHDMAYLHGQGNQGHSHGDEHHHRGPKEIAGIIDGAAMTDGAKAFAHRMFDCVAAAEARAHGVPVEEVHFHEVGAVDSIADIVAIAVAADDLACDGVVVSDLPCGRGTVRCQHGLIPVPAPATVFIAEAAGLILAPVDVEGELVTPTGAAAAAALRTEAALPERFVVKAIGMGAGKRAYDTPGILRAMLIEPLA